MFSNVLLSASSPSLFDREEWAWLQSHVYTTATGSVQNLLGGQDEGLTETGALMEFSRSLRAAVTHLLTKLNIPLYRVTLATATSSLFNVLHHFKTAKSKHHQKSLHLSAHVCYFWQAYQYGVYTRELLQFGDKVSVLLLLPPSEDFSSSYWPLVGTKEPDLTMPLQIFELGRSSPEKKFEIMKCKPYVLFDVLDFPGKITAKCRVVVISQRNSDDNNPH